MKIVITAATAMEWAVIKRKLNCYYNKPNATELQHDIFYHTSGVGLLCSTFSISTLVQQYKPDLIIQAGIAGSFVPGLQPGTVVMVRKEYLGDTGVEEHGVFKDVFDLQLAKPDEFPFEQKALVNPWLSILGVLSVPAVTSITVNQVSTHPQRIAHLKHTYGAEIETMEGAALHYVGLQNNTPFLQVRAISNMVGERDKTKWRIKEALDNLATTVCSIIVALPGEQLQAL